MAYPWYDGRNPPYVNPWADDSDPPADELICDFDPEDVAPETPRAIYDALCRQIIKQDEAKRCAAMVAYNALHGHAEHCFFVGPSGSGKTAIWRALKGMYPGMIEIVDGSRITQEGWRGDYKLADMLKSETILNGNGNVILVVDEADKTFSPRITSSGESVGQMLAAEFLKILDGIECPVVCNKTTYYVNTARISVVFCGAFSSVASDIAEKSNWKRIGFGDLTQDMKPYARELTGDDLIAYGVLPELVGRISRIVNLAPMTADDYYALLGAECSPAARLGKQYGVKIKLSPKTRKALAETAASSGLGVRVVESALRRKLDEALFDDCARASFRF